MRILALDYGSAQCGCALSDQTGTLATPIEPVARPGSKAGLSELALLIDEKAVELVIVGLPLTLAGGDSAQTTETRAFAKRLAEKISVRVELFDERFTTRMAQRLSGDNKMEHSRAAAYLLDSWIARRLNSQWAADSSV